MTDDDADTIFQTHILPALGVAEGGAKTPSWVFVGGQQGSGKTTRRAHIVDALGRQKTQIISRDDFEAVAARLPPEQTDANAPPSGGGRFMVWTEKLIERAFQAQANVVWEQPVPDYGIEYATIARQFGYRVECEILATPSIESWLATQRRDLNSGLKPISWQTVTDTYHRWPAFLAQAEDRVIFDRIAVLSRSGDLLFENHSQTQGGARSWIGQSFAFESLVVERNQPRTTAQVAALLADWADLQSAKQPTMADPADIGAFSDLLARLPSDPATGFDLNQPDPARAGPWIDRLAAELTATSQSPEGRSLKSLSGRADRLLALVRQMTGQPIR